MKETTQHRPWLEQLKQRSGGAAPAPDAAENFAKSVEQGSAKSAKNETLSSEVAWRERAFRERVPARGPIWPPRIRTTPLCDTASHCSLCGDALPTDPAPRFRRCRLCIQALWLALNVVREDVPVAQNATQETH
jgi:hypothetical protein